ncbi:MULTISPECIES: hypothetical protein [Amycolatopsis]|uniref:hypothetical protein n=1 Tax=Amycolatopsis TaxID=1813 RepID=UPI001E4C4399|nr:MULTISPECIES: hypothetical protein [Amycolatopsis]
MLTATKPMALTPEQLWVFVTGDNNAVDVARLAHAPEIGGFIALPISAFDPYALLPAYAPTGELLEGWRWATSRDVETYAHLFV